MILWPYNYVRALISSFLEGSRKLFSKLLILQNKNIHNLFTSAYKKSWLINLIAQDWVDFIILAWIFCIKSWCDLNIIININ